MMTATARPIDGTLRDEIEVNGRHTITTDEPEHLGGTDTGPRSHELLPAILAARVFTMITLYASARNINLDGLQVDVTYDNEATPRSVRTVVHLPDGLSAADQITRLQRVAHTCPVKRALEAGFTFETELAITTTAGSSSTELARRSSRPRRRSPRSITPPMSTRTNV
ncbi:MAG: OsmC family protein [Solirubrobacteraceae bacterium]